MTEEVLDVALVVVLGPRVADGLAQPRCAHEEQGAEPGNEVSLVLDSGALIALEKNDRAMWRRLKAALVANSVPVTHGGIVGQAWRGGGPRQALLSRALAGVDLTIEQGSFVVVIGTNGSGKSTLLNAVAGTFPLDAGTIRLAGRDVTRWPEHRRARLIGRVFQNPFSGTAPSMTIAENLALATRRGRRRGLGWALNKVRRAELRDRVRELGINLENRHESRGGDRR